MSYEFLRYELFGQVARLVVDNPPANALNSQMMLELRDAFGQLDSRTDVLAVVMTGAGSRFFVGGADVGQLFSVVTEEAGKDFSRQGQLVMEAIENCGRPVIAAINGLALGGGCELALACDIRIAAGSARFGQPEAGLGVIPGAGGTQRLPRLLGKGRAMEMMLTGDLVSAPEALRLGLVERVVPDDELMAAAQELACQFVSKSPEALRSIKTAVNQGLDASLEEGLRIERELFGRLCASEEKEERVRAFLDRRQSSSRLK
jgi:enoyl-CoA hydratase